MAAVTVSMSVPPVAAAPLVVVATPDGELVSVVSLAAPTFVALPVVLACADTLVVTAPTFHALLVDVPPRKLRGGSFLEARLPRKTVVRVLIIP